MLGFHKGVQAPNLPSKEHGALTRLELIICITRVGLAVGHVIQSTTEEATELVISSVLA